jgi:hypothetical protein
MLLRPKFSKLIQMGRVDGFLNGIHEARVETQQGSAFGGRQRTIEVIDYFLARLRPIKQALSERSHQIRGHKRVCPAHRLPPSLGPL